MHACRSVLAVTDHKLQRRRLRRDASRQSSGRCGVVSPESRRFGRTCARAGRGDRTHHDSHRRSGHSRLPLSISTQACSTNFARKRRRCRPTCSARISVHQGDMRSFALGRSDTRSSIIPFRAFLHNLTRDDQLAALRCAHAHLRPGGELALNVFHPSLEYMAANAGASAGVWRWRATRKLDGRRIRRVLRRQPGTTR